MNVQKELEALHKAEQKLRNKFGRKFTRLYNCTVSSISNNTRIIDTASEANVNLRKEADAATAAIAYLELEV